MKDAGITYISLLKDVEDKSVPEVVNVHLYRPSCRCRSDAATLHTEKPRGGVL